MICSRLLVLLLFEVVLCQLTFTKDELLNRCIDSNYHKSEPGPESELYKQCTPWKDRSCCTHDMTKEVHHGNLYNFNYDHCGHIKNMSAKCRTHFVQDLCFYQCSPNTGPWIVKVDMKIRKERFHNVPLCQADCDAWFEDCAEDYTCATNWVRNWNWTRTGNKCAKEAQCKTFRQTFGTAKDFCEKVWDESWEYTPNDQPCMRLWFDGSKGNPNKHVAMWKAGQLSGRNLSTRVSSHLTILVLMFATYL